MAKAADAFRARPRMRLSEWATRHFYLSAESSQAEQRWTPWAYQPGILDAMANDDIEEVDVRKSARVGYTKMLLAAVGYGIAHQRRNQALWQPTESDSDEFVRTELDPMLADVDAVASMQRGTSRRSGGNTLSLKSFFGSKLYLRGAAAQTNFRRITVANAYLDEVDGMDELVEGALDPISGAWKRTEGAPFRKMVIGSTPRVKGRSHIERREKVAHARLDYMVPCRHCGAEHPLAWGGADSSWGMKWERGKPETVRHICPHCQGSMTFGEYLARQWMGAWVSEDGAYRYGQDCAWRNNAGQPVAPPRRVCFRVWTAYSNQVTWATIADEFLQAVKAKKAGLSGPMQQWVNETKGEVYEEDVDRTEAEWLQARAEPYKLRRVPLGAVEVVAGVDTQDDRWEVVLWAFGRDRQLWCVDYQVIRGDPSKPEDWEQHLAPYLLRPVQHENGHEMPIVKVGIDTQGHNTHQAYGFVRDHSHRPWHALRGDPKPNQNVVQKPKPVDVNWRGRVVKRGVMLWHVGTDTAKDLLHGQLTKVRVAGPGYVHFSADLPLEFFSMLTAEQRELVKTARGMESRWVCPAGRRNEALDCTVYALWCMDALQVHKRTDAEWSRLESMLAEAPKPPAPRPAPQQPARRPSPIASESWSSRL